MTRFVRPIARSCRFLPLAAALIAVATVPRAARAQGGSAEPTEADEADAFAARNSLVGILGLGAPTGVVGIEYERALARSVTVAAGTGVGASGGVQGALMMRLRRVDGAIARGIGLGGSYGDADVPTFTAYPGIARTGTNELRDSVWLNGEIFFEHRLRAAALLRVAFGVGKAIRTGSCQYVPEEAEYLVPTPEECSDFGAHTILPLVDLAVSGAF